MFEGLNTNAADSGSIANMNNTAPSSTVFSLGSGGYTINPSGNKSMIAYCWSEVPGYSRFGSYVGNGSSTGPVIDCGFKPAFILIKGASNTTDWLIWDSARNLGYGALAANLSSAESYFGTTNTISVTDTGFQITTTNAVYNTSGATYIYAAFAEPAYGDLDLVNDSPTANAADPVKGNYPTFNPLIKPGADVFKNGNLTITTAASTYYPQVSTMATPKSGKWYVEFYMDDIPVYMSLGLTTFPHNYGPLHWIGAFNGLVYYDAGGGAVGNRYIDGSYVNYGESFTTGDCIALAWDADNGSAVFYKNGVSQGTITGVPVREYYLAANSFNNTTAATFSINFGQQTFKYTPPAGYKKLCTTNLPDPTITDGSKHFDAKLWTGDGNATRDISSYEFNPDFVWIKERPTNGWQHVLYDVIRGAGTSSVTKSLATDQNRTEASGNDTNHGFLSGFISNGFQLTKGSQASGDYVNHDGWGYVGWAWDAGSSTVSNNDGTITSSVRANPSAGFSIVTYTGTGSAGTWGHGLNDKPGLAFIKSRDSADNWCVYYNINGLGAGVRYFSLNTSSASTYDTTVFNNTEWTSAIAHVGASDVANRSGDNYVAYCFTSVAGYSKCGSYEGNGTTDNAFVYCGFRPKFVLFRNTSTHGGDWMLLDTSRRPNGPTGGSLVANVANGEDGYYNSGQVGFDFLSNGFKIRHNGSPGGDSGRTYIYLAIAENPFKLSRAY